MEQQNSIPGWYLANHSKKYHIFIDGKPLCNKKIYKTSELITPFGTIVREITENIGIYYEGCKKCSKLNNKRIIK